MMRELKRAKGWYKMRKEQRFKSFIKQLRDNSLRNLQKSHWYTLEDYEKTCRDFTKLTMWINKLSPYLLGMSCNLQRLNWLDNFSKRNKYNLLN